MAESLYVGRPPTARSEGRKPLAACPCSLLLLVHQDERIDDGATVYALCPACAAGWVWDVAYADAEPPTPEMSVEDA